YKRYEKYTRQKAYRVLNREIAAGGHSVGIRHTGGIDVSAIPLLQEALDEYTSRRGRTVTRWSRASLEERVEVIGKRSKVDTTILLMCLLAIYDDGSEALHGTLYGCTFHLGVFEGSVKDRTELSKNINGAICMVFFISGLMLHELLSTLCQQNDLPELMARAKDRVTHYAEVLRKALPT
ncbi:MAG: hypothetical protein NTU41_08580, partial [Chloroflexi bacterium]|nr:hypothetical protein [Chloroflexota bacterium]